MYPLGRLLIGDHFLYGDAAATAAAAASAGYVILRNPRLCFLIVFVFLCIRHRLVRMTCSLWFVFDKGIFRSLPSA